MNNYSYRVNEVNSRIKYIMSKANYDFNYSGIPLRYYTQKELNELVRYNVIFDYSVDVDEKNKNIKVLYRISKGLKIEEYNHKSLKDIRKEKLKVLLN